MAGRERTLHRPVALKQDIVVSDPTSDGSYPGATGRLLIEACAAATVNHEGAQSGEVGPGE